MKRCKFTQTRLVVTNMCNTNLLGVNSKYLSESFCLIVTKFFFTTMSLSSLIWYDFMFLSLWSVAKWRRATLLTVFMVVATSAGCGRGVSLCYSHSRLARSTTYHYFFLCLHSQSRHRPAPLPSRVGRRSLIIRRRQDESGAASSAAAASDSGAAAPPSRCAGRKTWVWTVALLSCWRVPSLITCVLSSFNFSRFLTIHSRMQAIHLTSCSIASIWYEAAVLTYTCVSSA